MPSGPYVIPQVSHEATAVVCVVGCYNWKSTEDFGILIFHGVFTSYRHGRKILITTTTLTATAAAAAVVVTVPVVPVAVVVVVVVASTAAALASYVGRRDVNQLKAGA